MIVRYFTHQRHRFIARAVDVAGLRRFLRALGCAVVSPGGTSGDAQGRHTTSIHDRCWLSFSSKREIILSGIKSWPSCRARRSSPPIWR
jgi:hypothetical protein